MDLDVQAIDMKTNVPTVVINEQDAEELGVNPLDRVEIGDGDETVIAIVDITDNMVQPGDIGVTRGITELAGTVDVILAPKPDSVAYIRRKLDDNELSREHIATIIEDIYEDRLNDIELGAYVSAIYSNGMSMDETIHLTREMVDMGEVMDWDADVVADKHSIGGVAGNRVTPIIVPIVAAAGLTIPKTSSRAITSPAGTADTVEVLCDVDFSIAEIKDIVEETGGCMVWGGSVNLSPVDDKIIRAEHPLSIDPDGQVLASVLSKKKSAGSTHVVIDIPYGEGSKVEDLAAAREMAHDFKKVGGELGMAIVCTITKGSEPLGRGIGPILEAQDVLKVLNGAGPEDLRMKSIRLTDALFDLCDVDASAADILDSGEALEKFQEIVAAQNGDPAVAVDDLEPGSETVAVTADRAGTITHIDNEGISAIARRAGAPTDNGAGIYLQATVGDSVDEDEPLFTVYAENADKLAEAEDVLADREPVRVRQRQEQLIEQT
jgi:AMP phosphorylase